MAVDIEISGWRNECLTVSDGNATVELGPEDLRWLLECMTNSPVLLDLLRDWEQDTDAGA